ncbi:MAG TPA: hypothetical protein PLL20_01125 [Phycisphaerae bacterium]|nr:hypothetical protein [Phycisphaerae bacterium]
MPDPTLSNAIRENAAGPAKASGDAGSVEQHSLADQIEADRYLASKEAVQNPRRGVRFSKIVPPGSA